MPWDQTEALCRSTVEAAAEPRADDDGSTPRYEVVDLGEAGRQEIWETGTARIVKLIAKHGGKQPPARYKEAQEVRVLVARFGSSRSLLWIVDVPADHRDYQRDSVGKAQLCLRASFTTLHTALTRRLCGGRQRIPVFIKAIDTASKGFRAHRQNDFTRGTPARHLTALG